MSALNVDSAIGAHLAWKRRLEYVILGVADTEMELDVVCDDTKCLLGMWLIGEGRNHEAWQAYPTLLERHRLFHWEACQIVGLFHKGKTADALELLNGEFDRLSTEVVDLLAQLRNHLNQQNGRQGRSG